MKVDIMSVKDEILQQLESNKGSYISGGQLANNLGVSRNAVWKAKISGEERVPDYCSS